MVGPWLALSAAFASGVMAGLNQFRELFDASVVLFRNLAELERRSVRVPLFDICVAVEAFDRTGEARASSHVLPVRHFVIGRSLARALSVLNGCCECDRQRSYQCFFRADQVFRPHVEFLLFDARPIFAYFLCDRLLLSDPRPEPAAIDRVGDSSLCVGHKLAAYHWVCLSVDLERLSLRDGDLFADTVGCGDRLGEKIDGVGELVAPEVFVSSVAQVP